MEPIYLDNAATSHPKPPEVLEAVRLALTEYNANPGRSGHRQALRAGRMVLECREAVAGLLGAADPLSITFAQNCTDALNLAIHGIAPRQGGHIVSTMLEHNSVLRVLEDLRERQGLEYTLLAPGPDGRVEPDAFRRSLRPDTVLIECTHASNVTGAIQPVGEIGAVAREAGLPFLVDGAQAFGALPFSLADTGASLYAFPGHKALCGPQGTGGLYIAPGLILHPLRQGGTGTGSESIRQPEEAPERYESGTVNLPGLAGLASGVRVIAADIASARERERALTEALLDGLHAMGGVSVYGPGEAADRVGTVAFNMDDLSSAELADRLDKREIAVRGGLHCAPMIHRVLGTLERGAVRASIGRYTTMDEIARFLLTLEAIPRET